MKWWIKRETNKRGKLAIANNVQYTYIKRDQNDTEDFMVNNPFQNSKCLNIIRYIFVHS